MHSIEKTHSSHSRMPMYISGGRAYTVRKAFIPLKGAPTSVADKARTCYVVERHSGRNMLLDGPTGKRR